MDNFIRMHVLAGYFLLVLGVLAALTPTLRQNTIRLWTTRAFFMMLWIMGFGGLIVGVYRHPTSLSAFQLVTCIGLVFATIGLLTLSGKLDGFSGRSRHFWYINGLGGSLIATVSASLFFIALQFFPVFYKTNIIWFIIVFIAVPVLLGQYFIKMHVTEKT